MLSFFLELPLLIKLGLIVASLIGGLKLYLVATTGICTSTRKLNGKTVIVTGANTGIGKETALDLAQRGAKVILACRDLKRATVAKDEIIEKTGNKNVVVRHLDLSSLQSVRNFAAEILKTESRLDVLINNAGCALLEKKMTEDGLEYQMQTNYFGHFLLTNLLLGILKQSAPSRIVNVSSVAHTLVKKFDLNNLNSEISYVKSQVYANTKLCQVLSTCHLAPLVKQHGVTVNSLHPGVVKTEIGRHMGRLLMLVGNVIAPIICKNAKQGAQTTIHLAVADEVANITGEYFSDCKIAETSSLAKDAGLAKKLWEISETMVQLKPEERHF